jgi:transcription elongation GreA/GreB family factor
MLSVMGIRERKQFFVDELKRQYRDLISGAYEAETQAAVSAEQIRSEARRKEDAKGALQAGRMAVGHQRRRERAAADLERLVAFGSKAVAPFRSDAPVDLGAMIDVSIEGDDGPEERTLFLLPAGAGAELHGPGGDGFVHVISPESPVGRAVRGARAGDSFEVVIRGTEREWTVVDIC